MNRFIIGFLLIPASGNLFCEPLQAQHQTLMNAFEGKTSLENRLGYRLGHEDSPPTLPKPYQSRPTGLIPNLQHVLFAPILGPVEGAAGGIALGMHWAGRRDSRPLLEGPFTFKEIALGIPCAILGLIFGIAVLIPWKIAKHLAVGFYDLFNGNS